MATNLDALINKIGFEIVKEIKNKGNEKTKYKNEIDKALGVLANDGVYSYYVYVKSKKIDDIFLSKLAEVSQFILLENSHTELNQSFFEDLSNNLNSLLFFREILEKILIYARYHAKAIGE
ncbi:hypothetical protein [Desulfurobacterium sp.]